jgi:hypothetical protein
MGISLRLYQGVVYIPTSHRVERDGFLLQKSPVECAPVAQSERLREAIRATHARSWDTLDRQTKGLWSLVEKNGLYEIRVDQPMEARGWREDETKRVRFPPGTAVENVIDRLIAMIQECAGR